MTKKSQTLKNQTPPTTTKKKVESGTWFTLGAYHIVLTKTRDPNTNLDIVP